MTDDLVLPSLKLTAPFWKMDVERLAFPFGKTSFQRRTLSFRVKQLWVYSCCWWKKSYTSSYGKYPIICRVLYIPGGSGFLPWTVCLAKKQPINPPLLRLAAIPEVHGKSSGWMFIFGRRYLQIQASNLVLTQKTSRVLVLNRVEYVNKHMERHKKKFKG